MTSICPATKQSCPSPPRGFSTQYANRSSQGATSPCAPSSFRPELHEQAQLSAVARHRKSVHQDRHNALSLTRLKAHYEDFQVGDEAALEKELKWNLKSKIAEAHRYQSQVAAKSDYSMNDAAAQKKRLQLMTQLMEDVNTVFLPIHSPLDGGGPLRVYEGITDQLRALHMWNA